MHARDLNRTKPRKFFLQLKFNDKLKILIAWSYSLVEDRCLLILAFEFFFFLVPSCVASRNFSLTKIWLHIPSRILRMFVWSSTYNERASLSEITEARNYSCSIKCRNTTLLEMFLHTIAIYNVYQRNPSLHSANFQKKKGAETKKGNNCSGNGSR